MSWLYKYFRLVLGSTYPALQLHDATLTISGTGASLTLASGATVTEFSTDGTMGGNSDTAVPTEKAIVTYVASNTAGLKWKAPVRIATVANGTLATAYANGQTVDGKALVTGDRILLKDQSDQTANGIYTVNATGAPTRGTDADTGTELLGCVVAVLEGDVNEDSAWCNTNSTTITIGSSNITFAIFGGLKAGNGLTFTADVAAINTAITADLTTVQTFTNKTLTSPKINEDVVMSKTATEINAAVVASHSQNTDTGTTATTFTVDSDSTTGKFALTAAGGGNFTLTLQTPTIAGAVAITLPAVTGTLATLDGAEALTNKTNVSITSQSSAYNNSALNVGKYGTAIADTLLVDNILVSFNNSSGVNKTAADTSSMTMYVGSRTTAAVTNNKMQGILSSSTIAHNVYDAYAGQFHLGISGSMGTQNANAHLTGMSAKVSFSNTPTVATGWVTAGLFIIEGAGTITQMCHGVSIVEEAGSTGAQSLLHLNTDVGTTPYFSFAGADGTGKSIYTHTAAGTQLGTIKILVNGAAKWIPFMQAE